MVPSGVDRRDGPPFLQSGSEVETVGDLDAAFWRCARACAMPFTLAALMSFLDGLDGLGVCAEPAVDPATLFMDFRGASSLLFESMICNDWQVGGVRGGVR